MKNKKIFWTFFVLALFLLLSSSAVYAAKKLKLNLTPLHFGAQNPANKSMPKGIELARPWIFNWNNIEKTKGVYNWKTVDAQYKGLQKKKFKTLGVIIPFAKWDQLNRSNHEACKTSYKEAEKVGIEYICNPNDWSAYRKFLTKLVDRYDGDGKNDMPGLKIPVRAWEVWNEPEFEDYYIGSARDYAYLLDATYHAIKKEDKKATVLNGGLASTGTKSLSFWKKVFATSSSRHFDALSLHCISCSKDVFNVKEFNTWAKKNKVSKKRIWLTELLPSGENNAPLSDDEAAKLLVKGFSYAFAHKVDKIFMVELNYFLSDYTKTKSALKLFIQKTKNFQTATKNTEFLLPDNSKIIIGVYEFKMPSGHTVMTAWGGGQLSLGGTVVSATDIYGNAVTIENNVVELGEVPYIIEVK